VAPRSHVATALLLGALAVLVVVVRSGGDDSESATTARALAGQQEAWADADRAWNEELTDEGGESARLSADEARELAARSAESPIAGESEPVASPNAMPPEQLIALDAEAMSQVRVAQTALEAYAVDRGGSYVGARASDLRLIEPTLPISLAVRTSTVGYTVTVTSESGNSFSITRGPDGSLSDTCHYAGVGGCEAGGTWL
jgi:hypothetical protein